MESNKSKHMLWTFALCSFLVGLDSLVVAPIVPQIARDLGFQVELGGLLVTAYALLYGLSAPLFGPISDRWGRKNMLLLGVLVFAIGTALTSLASNLTFVLIYRGIAGLGGAMLMPSIYATVADTYTYENRGKAMGMIMGAMIGSQVIGVPLGGFLSKYVTWKFTFIIIAFIAFLALLAIGRNIPKAPPPRTIKVGPVKAYFSQFSATFSNISIFFALFSTFLWMAGLQGMFAYVGVYYDTNFGLDVDRIGLIAMVAAAASVLGSIFGGRISDKLGKASVIGIAAIFSSLGVLVFSLLTGYLWWAIVTQAIWAFFVGCGSSTLTALMSELNPSIRGTVLSLNSSAMYIGMTASTVVSAQILQSGIGFLSIGIICAVATIMVLPITRYFIKEEKHDIHLQSKSVS